MTHLNDIFDSNWDNTIATEPNYYKKRERNETSIRRGILTHHILISEMYEGTINRDLYDPESYDAYVVYIITETSKDDLRNMLTAAEKIMSQYSPSSEENIIIWEEGELINNHPMRWVFRFNVLVKKVGKAMFD